MKCFTAQDRAKLDRQAVVLARDPDSPLERALARFGATLGIKGAGRSEPPDRLIGARVPSKKSQMARVTRVTLLTAGLLASSGLAMLGYETYARTTITVGRAFSYGGIYAPRGSEMPMQIIDWWFGTSAAGSLLLASAVLFLLAFFLASKTS